MNAIGEKGVLQIKKYPNRRFYDTNRSRHVTLQELHDAIVEGYDVVITDSRTGQVITNLVLTQILLEKSPPKLEVFPSWTLHQLIRSNKQVVRSSIDRFFGPFTEMLAASQRQFESYVRQAMGGKFVSPMDWARDMMQAFSPPGPSTATDDETAEHDEDGPSESHKVATETASSREDRIDDLRRQLAELTSKIESLNGGKDGSPSGDQDR